MDRRAYVFWQGRAARAAIGLADPTFDDLEVRLRKPKFDRYVSQERRSVLLADLEAAAEWTAINDAFHACRDPDDEKFLDTAVAAQAECIVTCSRSTHSRIFGS